MEDLDMLRNSAFKLLEGFQYFDQYDPVPSDDTQIFAVPDGDDLHKFAAEEGALTVGNLRDVLALLIGLGVIPNANS